MTNPVELEPRLFPGVRDPTVLRLFGIVPFPFESGTTLITIFLLDLLELFPVVGGVETVGVPFVLPNRLD